jgi:hypothetical protein
LIYLASLGSFGVGVGPQLGVALGHRQDRRRILAPDPARHLAFIRPMEAVPQQKGVEVKPTSWQRPEIPDQARLQHSGVAGDKALLQAGVPRRSADGDDLVKETRRQHRRNRGDLERDLVAPLRIPQQGPGCCSVDRRLHDVTAPPSHHLLTRRTLAGGDAGHRDWRSGRHHGPPSVRRMIQGTVSHQTDELLLDPVGRGARHPIADHPQLLDVACRPPVEGDDKSVLSPRSQADLRAGQ